MADIPKRNRSGVRGEGDDYQHIGEHLADADSDGSETRGLPVTARPQHARASHRGFPPRPDDHDGWRRWVETGGPEPVLCRDVDGAPHRLDRRGALADRLHLAGNGLVPQCAAEALRQLLRRMT